MLHFHLVLSAVILAAPTQEQELVINPVPRALVAERTEQFTFEKDFAEFRALNQCRLALEDGALLVLSEGEDPYLARTMNMPGEQFRIRITMKTTHPGALACYWTTPSDPQFSERRVRSVHLVPDGTWQQYQFEFAAPGGLSHLRIDPGTQAGRYFIRSVEIIGFAYHPLEIDRAKQTKEGVLFRVRNRGNQPVRCRHRNEVFELAPQQSQEVLEPVVAKQVLEKVTIQIDAEGYPPVERSIYLYHDAAPARWSPLVPEGTSRFQVEICPEANVGRIRDNGKTLAVLAPLGAKADPRGPGLLGEIPSLRLQPHDGPGCLLAGEGLRVRIVPVGDELAIELWQEGVPFAASGTAAGAETSAEAGSEIEGPVVRVFGQLEQGLFAGLEYLGKGEPSSSKADIETKEHIRFAPDRLKVTMPLMVFVSSMLSTALTWEDMQLQPVYATPNFFDGSPEHRMSLRGRHIQATLKLGRERVEDCILWAVRKHGLPPLPEPPRTREEQSRLCLWALTEGPLRDANGWGHCVEPNWTRHFYVDMVSTIWHLSGQLPQVPDLVPNGAHIPNEAAWLLTGRAEQWLQHLRSRTEQLLRSQQPDGSFRYRGEFQRGHFEDTASGHCARPAALLLEAAYYLGDKQALEAGLKTLQYMKRFCVPRGAQTWELSLHTPDILASAELVRAYVRGYELTGNEDYLAEARRWALSGIPFVYQWGEYPVMVYATIPVYGATHWRAPNWMGLPVQWCGLVYAYAINSLAQYDQTVDWRHLARGILIAAQQMQVPLGAGPNAGLLPDAFRIQTQQRLGPFINPCAIVSLDRAVHGEIHRVVVAANDRHRVVAPFPIQIDGPTAIIVGKPGVAYQIVVDGQRILTIQSKGTDQILLDEIAGQGTP
jgi:hypothetical protein